MELGRLLRKDSSDCLQNNLTDKLERMLDFEDPPMCRMNISLRKNWLRYQQTNFARQYNSIHTFVCYFDGKESKLGNPLHKFVQFSLHNTSRGIKRRIYVDEGLRKKVA